jgi:hypothetical protein
VFVAMGVLTWLLAAPHGEAGAGSHRLVRGLIVAMALGLVGYLWTKASFVAQAMVGLWPLSRTLGRGSGVRGGGESL